MRASKKNARQEIAHDLDYSPGTSSHGLGTEKSSLTAQTNKYWK